MKKSKLRAQLSRLCAVRLALCIACMGPPALAAQAFSPLSPMALGESYGCVEDIASPAISGLAWMAASGGPAFLAPLPITARMQLAPELSLDLGSKLSAAILPFGAGPVLFVEPSAGLSWWPLGVFESGPFLSGGLLGTWRLDGDLAMTRSAVRAGAGLNLKIDLRTMAFAALTVTSAFRAGGAEGLSIPGSAPYGAAPGLDLVLGYAIRI